MVLKANTISYVLLLLFFLVFPTQAQELKNHKDTQVKFEVSSVRVMTAEESARRQSDNIGIDVVVKLRLSNMGQMTIHFYTTGKDDIIPSGYSIRSDQNGIAWITGLESVTNKPLGINRLIKQDGGSWLRLPTGTSIEYELFDSSTAAGEKHAQTFYMKDSDKGKIYEVYSDLYTVPRKEGETAKK